MLPAFHLAKLPTFAMNSTLFYFLCFLFISVTLLPFPVAFNFFSVWRRFLALENLRAPPLSTFYKVFFPYPGPNTITICTMRNYVRNVGVVTSYPKCQHLVYVIYDDICLTGNTVPNFGSLCRAHKRSRRDLHHLTHVPSGYLSLPRFQDLKKYSLFSNRWLPSAPF